jgi:hypothetical protein
VDESRREFLVKLVAAGVASFAGCSVVSPKCTNAAQLANRAPNFEILREPLVLRSGETLENRSFGVSEQFRNTPAGAIIVVAGDDVTIRNVRLIGPPAWDPHWNDRAPAVSQQLGLFGKSVGIRAQNVRNLLVQAVSIEGVPGAAIFGHGLDHATFSDIRISHCYHGIQVKENAPNLFVTIRRVYVSDLWGPPPEFAHEDGKAGNPSLSRLGGWIGGDALALNTLQRSVVRDCVAVGEMFAGFKFVSSQQVTIANLRGPSLVIQGGIDGFPEPARNTVVRDCVFDKGMGRGEPMKAMNCVQLSGQIDSILLERCLLDGAGMDGHGIQASGRIRLTARRCTIRGFNGVRGANPAFALHLARGGTVNSDFEHVNSFVDQKRIRLDHPR